MTLHLFTIDEKISVVDKIIESIKHGIEIRESLMRARGADDKDLNNDGLIKRLHRELRTMQSVAQDLRSRQTHIPHVAAVRLLDRMNAVARRRAQGQDVQGALIGVAEEAIANWPTIKQALEQFREA